MAEQKSSLLIVEDNRDVAGMLDDFFRVQNYDVVTVNWGEDGLNSAQETPPDLVILDVQLPDVDGFEVARQLRSRRRTQDTPIIFLTQHNERSDRLRGLALAAEDYITIPFDIQELRLRVRNALRRTARSSLTNPVTGLPEGALVDERLSECLQGQAWGIVLASLQNLEGFRDLYGFIAADDVLRAVAAMLQDTLREVGGPGDFLGHLSAEEFLLITEPGYLEPLAELAKQRLTPAMIFFYKEIDRQADIESGRLLSIRISALPFRPGIESINQLKTLLRDTIQ